MILSCLVVRCRFYPHLGPEERPVMIEVCSLELCFLSPLPSNKTMDKHTLSDAIKNLVCWMCDDKQRQRAPQVRHRRAMSVDARTNVRFFEHSIGLWEQYPRLSDESDKAGTLTGFPTPPEAQVGNSLLPLRTRTTHVHRDGEIFLGGQLIRHGG